MCYTNPEPSGRWAEEKYSPFAVQGVYLVKAMPPTEVACRGLGDVTIGGPVWVNRVKLQPRAGGRASVDCCRWPSPGRQHGEGLVATRVAAAAGHGGVVALNVYPPSRDAQSAPAATLWSSSQTDLRPLFKAAIASAAGLTRGASNVAVQLCRRIRPGPDIPVHRSRPPVVVHKGALRCLRLTRENVL